MVLHEDTRNFRGDSLWISAADGGELFAVKRIQFAERDKRIEPKSVCPFTVLRFLYGFLRSLRSSRPASVFQHSNLP